MQIVRNQRIPVHVTVGNLLLQSGAFRQTDLLVDAQVLVVFDIRLTAQLKREGAAARVQDITTGEIITIQGFNDMAAEVAELRPGQMISAFGKAHEYMRKPYFDVSQFIKEPVEVKTGRLPERELAPAKPSPVEGETLNGYEDELAAAGRDPNYL